VTLTVLSYENPPDELDIISKLFPSIDLVSITIPVCPAFVPQAVTITSPG
jgi:hypothetical protein